MKPDNVLIDYNEDDEGNGILNRLALSDFGISMVTKSESM